MNTKDKQTIPLSECFVYDSEQACLRWVIRPPHHFHSPASHARWNKIHAGTVAGYSTGRYMSVRHNGVCKKVHRVIWELHNGPIPEGMLMDHIDGNSFNNTLANLRLCYPFQSARNRKCLPKKHGSLKGAFFNKNNGRWESRIRVNGIRISIGSFATEKEAHEAYRAASQKHHGEFGKAQ